MSDTIKPETALPSEPQVRSSELLGVLRKYWNERIERKRTTAQKMAENGEYALAHRLSVEADAIELCLKDLETKSTITKKASDCRQTAHEHQNQTNATNCQR